LSAEATIIVNDVAKTYRAGWHREPVRALAVVLINLFYLVGGGFSPAGGHDHLFAETDYQLIHSANPRFFIPGVRGRWSRARRGPSKLIRIPRTGGDLHEIYDLSADPGEEHLLDLSLDPASTALMRDLEGWVDYDEGAGANLEETLSPEQRERLRSLGYLQ